MAPTTFSTSPGIEPENVVKEAEGQVKSQFGIDDRPRLRISYKQSAKGVIQLEGTVEMATDTVRRASTKDVGNVEVIPIGQQLVEMHKITEELFKLHGYKVAADEGKAS